MSKAKCLKLMQQGFFLTVLCLSPGWAQLVTAAEVKPIAVEVVGESGSSQPVVNLPVDAPQAPPAPHAPPPHYPMAEHWPQMMEDLLIPVLAILLIFGGPVLLVIVIAVLRYRAAGRREKAQSENIARLLEAGRDVPLELLHGGVGLRTAENNLRKGITNVGVGIGLTVFLVTFLGIAIGSVGFIMIGMGLSQLAVWKLIDSKKAPVNTDGDSYRL